MVDPTVVMNFEKDPNIGITKRVLHAGRGDVPNYGHGTKVLHIMFLIIYVYLETKSKIIT